MTNDHFLRTANRHLRNARLFLVFATVALAANVAIVACSGSGQQTPVQTAATAASVRDLVCTQVALMAPSTPELERINQLCQQGAMLKPIAAAYAGCQESASVPVVQPPAEPPADTGVKQPWPDAGAEPPSGSSP